MLSLGKWLRLLHLRSPRPTVGVHDMIVCVQVHILQVPMLKWLVLLT